MSIVADLSLSLLQNLDSTCLLKWESNALNNSDYIVLKSEIIRNEPLYATGQVSTWFQKTLVPAGAVDLSGVILITDLSNGLNYSFTFTQTIKNVATGAVALVQSVSVNGTPAGVPSAPTLNNFSDASGAVIVDVSFNSNGGAPVTQICFFVYDASLSSIIKAPSLFYFDVSGSRVPPSPSQFTLTGLTNYTGYEIAAVSINNVGESALSNTIKGYANPFPSAPQNLTLTASSQQIVATWQAPAVPNPIVPGDPLSYIVGIQGGTLDSSFNIGAALTYAFTSLTNGTPYTIKVWAKNQSGITLVPAQGIKTPANIPGPVQNVVGTIAIDSSLCNITWSNPASIGGGQLYGFKIYDVSNGLARANYICTVPYQIGTGGGAWSNAQNANYFVDASAGFPGYSLSLSYIIPTYAFSIAALTTVGEGDKSTPVTIKPYVTPAAPTILGQYNAVTGSIDLSFNAPVDPSNSSQYYGYPVVGYVLTKTDASGNNAVIIQQFLAVSGQTSYGFSYTTPTSGANYFSGYQVMSVNGTNVNGLNPTNPTNVNVGAVPSAIVNPTGVSNNQQGFTVSLGLPTTGMTPSSSNCGYSASITNNTGLGEYTGNLVNLVLDASGRITNSTTLASTLSTAFLNKVNLVVDTSLSTVQLVFYDLIVGTSYTFNNLRAFNSVGNGPATSIGPLSVSNKPSNLVIDFSYNLAKQATVRLRFNNNSSEILDSFVLIALDASATAYDYDAIAPFVAIDLSNIPIPSDPFHSVVFFRVPEPANPLSWSYTIIITYKNLYQPGTIINNVNVNPAGIEIADCLGIVTSNVGSVYDSQAN